MWVTCGRSGCSACINSPPTKQRSQPAPVDGIPDGAEGGQPHGVSQENSQCRADVVEDDGPGGRHGGERRGREREGEEGEKRERGADGRGLWRRQLEEPGRASQSFALVTCGACRRTDGLRGSDRDRGAAMTRLERAFLIHVAPTRERDYVNLCYYYYDVVDT